MAAIEEFESMDIDRVALLAWRDTAAANAASLAKDATILLQNGRWSGAYGLAILAMEEVGKSWLCQNRLSGIAVPTDDIRNSHVRKITACRQMLAAALLKNDPSVSQQPGEFVFGKWHQDAADDSYHLRLACLYVDLTKDGVVGGAGSVSEQDARNAIEITKIAVEVLDAWIQR